MVLRFTGHDHNKSGAVSLPHGDTLIGTLRQTHGWFFARGCADAQKLSSVLHRLDHISLSQILTAELALQVRTKLRNEPDLGLTRQAESGKSTRRNDYPGV